MVLPKLSSRHRASNAVTSPVVAEPLVEVVPPATHRVPLPKLLLPDRNASRVKALRLVVPELDTFFLPIIPIQYFYLMGFWGFGVFGGLVEFGSLPDWR